MDSKQMALPLHLGYRQPADHQWARAKGAQNKDTKQPRRSWPRVDYDHARFTVQCCDIRAYMECMNHRPSDNQLTILNDSQYPTYNAVCTILLMCHFAIHAVLHSIVISCKYVRALTLKVLNF